VPLHPPACRQRCRSADKVLGKDPETGLDVALKTGRFGSYLQLGETGKDKEEKPKRAGIPKGWALEDITSKSRSSCSRCRARSARARGRRADPGRHRPLRPYVQHGKTYANLEPARTCSPSASIAPSR
jgi:DNA topoisomerase-1